MIKDNIDSYLDLLRQRRALTTKINDTKEERQKGIRKDKIDNYLNLVREQKSIRRKIKESLKDVKQDFFESIGDGYYVELSIYSRRNKDDCYLIILDQKTGFQIRCTIFENEIKMELEYNRVLYSDTVERINEVMDFIKDNFKNFKLKFEDGEFINL